MEYTKAISVSLSTVIWNEVIEKPSDFRYEISGLPFVMPFNSLPSTHLLYN